MYGLKLIKSHFPSHVILGRTMNLTCDYDAEGATIYQVKWYKDEQEFYTYNPGRPAKEFGLSGVDINIDVSIAPHMYNYACHLVKRCK